MNLDNMQDGFKLSLIGYMENPSDMKGTIMNLKIIKDSMEQKYTASITKHKEYVTKVYTTDDKKVYVLVEVPSESYKLSYQVMLEMSYENTHDYVDDLSLKIFSNCPSFTYTYAYVYNIRGLIIPELKDKYAKDVFTKSPEQRNYFKVTSYEKSLYYAFAYILDNFKTVDDLLKGAKNSKRHNPFDDVKSDKEIIDLYDRKRREYNKAKKENVVVALADKIRKDKNRNVKSAEKVKPKINATAAKSSNRQHVKSKISGKSKKTGKSKIR